jgi:DNA-binding HxlR family transcriptional regulator
MPVRVEYSLTDRGRSLIPILMELRDWGDANL